MFAITSALGIRYGFGLFTAELPPENIISMFQVYSLINIFIAHSEYYENCYEHISKCRSSSSDFENINRQLSVSRYSIVPPSLFQRCQSCSATCGYVSCKLLPLHREEELMILATALKDKLYRPTRICMIILCLQFIGTLITIFVQCTPISYFWDRQQKGSCINTEAFFYCESIFSMTSQDNTDK
jgi:hypothetical protein